jgi:hypothetical protein
VANQTLSVLDMSMKTPLLVTALGVVALSLTACGADSDAATPETTKPAPTSSVQPSTEAPAGPKIAEPTVAPLRIDDSVHNLYGDQMVETAYDEVVDLATVLAFNPDLFLHDGNNTAADLYPIQERLVPKQRPYLSTQFDDCLAGNRDACGNVVGVTYFDNGTTEKPYSYREDGEFVTDQTIANATAVGVIPNLGTSHLDISFDHVSHVRLVFGGKDVTVTMTRNLVYSLVPSPGTATTWLIDNWKVNYQGAVIDEATGQPIEG